VTAEFPQGVPAAAAEKPILVFTDLTSNNVNFAKVSATLSQSESIGTPLNANLKCSFAGGCPFSFDSVGVSGKLDSHQEVNNITVCGEFCPFDRS